MAKENIREISLSGDFDRVTFKDGTTVEFRPDGGLLLMTNRALEVKKAANGNTMTAIAAAQKAYEIGEEIKGGIYDGNIYVGLSAKTGKPLVTTAADIGIYSPADAEQAVANLNRPDNGGWRLPSGYWDKVGDELNNNLFENRNKGKLVETFNLTGEDPAGWYLAADRYGVSDAACQQFSGGDRYHFLRNYRSSVRPVREFSPRS